MPTVPSYCSVCTKATKAECSHVDCPNRHRITAQAVGERFVVSGVGRDGRSLGGECTARVPHMFED